MMISKLLLDTKKAAQGDLFSKLSKSVDANLLGRDTGT